jgi:hypothetical protein
MVLVRSNVAAFGLRLRRSGIEVGANQDSKFYELSRDVIMRWIEPNGFGQDAFERKAVIDGGID